MTYIERTPNSYVGLRPVDPETERSVLASYASLPDSPVYWDNPEPHRLAPRWRPLERGTAFQRLADLRPGEADIVRSAEVISIVRRVSKKVGGKWSWWAKANGVWIVERTA